MASDSENDLVLSESTLPLINEDSYFNAISVADYSDSTVEDYAKQWASSVSKRWFPRSALFVTVNEIQC